jgi:hypothetical protein
VSRGRDAAERYAERKRREDEAPRLRDVVPRLTACRLELEEGRAGFVTPEVAHTRRIVVAHAPALFVIPCGEPSCRDGGHDVSMDLLRGLREGRGEIRGEDTCYGHTGTADCGRVLRFAAFVEYSS